MSTDTLDRAAIEAARSVILSDPERVLDDTDVLRALVGAEAGRRGRNVHDLRGAAMAKLEGRLEGLQAAHQSVLAAAYRNVSTTQQVHRAILTMLEPAGFDEFLDHLDTHVAETLRLRAIRVVLEADDERPDCDLNRLTHALSLLPRGGIDQIVGTDRSGRSHPVLLRSVPQGQATVYGTAALEIRSEALVRLDLGAHRVPGLLALGAGAADHFAPGQATDLLELFARVCARLLRGWLG